MNTYSTSTLRSIRVLLVTLALALASTVGFAASDVSAFVQASAVTTGGAAGGGGSADINQELADQAPQASGPYVRAY